MVFVRFLVIFTIITVNIYISIIIIFMSTLIGTWICNTRLKIAFTSENRTNLSEMGEGGLM